MIGDARDLRGKPQSYLDDLLASCGNDPVAKMMLTAKYEAVNVKDPVELGNPCGRLDRSEDTEHPGFWLGGKHFNTRGEEIV